MKPSSVAFSFLIAALLLISFDASAVSFAPDELIVKLRRAPQRSALDEITGTNSTRLDAYISSSNAEVKEPLAAFRNRYPETAKVLKLSTPQNSNLDSLQSLLESDPEIEWVTRNYRYPVNGNSLDYSPNDPMFSQAWWLETIFAPQAWEITKGDSSIIIGVIDTGVDYLHPDLVGSIWHNWADADSDGVDDDDNGFIDDVIGWDFVDAPAFPAGGDYLERDNNPMDEHGHGTYVGGIACAVSDNGTCFPSIGFNCHLMCLRAGNVDGNLEEDDVAAAILYGAANGVSVINMSFGDVVASPLLRETCRIAYEQGVVLVASAGNKQTDEVHYPSGFPEVISVGATDRIDHRASYSNYGPSIDIMAPGSEILSTIIGGECGVWNFSTSGTSFASPMVGATAALIRSVNATLTPADILDIIKSSAFDLRQQGWDDSTANGRLDVFRAVEMAAHGSDIVARITSPYNDTGVTEAFSVFGEAWGADFEFYNLRYGLGDNPEEWTLVSTSSERHYGDVLGIVPVPDVDTVMVVQLEVWGGESIFSTDHVHLYVQHNAPSIDSMKVYRMLDGDSYMEMVHVWSNQTTSAGMLLTNQAGDSVREEFGYVSTEHVGLLSPSTYPGRWQVRVRLVNLAGLEVISDPFDFEINDPPFSSNEWVSEPTNLPNGDLGNFLSDYDCNGHPEVWLLPDFAEDSLEILAPWEWTPSGFVDTGNRYGRHFPRAWGDADGDSLMEMMALRSPETRIWEQRTACSLLDTVAFESYPDWNEMLGGEFIELDSTDNHHEMIARVGITGVGARFMLFRVNPDYSLTVLDTLPNESALPSNLGPPTVIVEDLDDDGLLDFLYGDYGGDVVICEWTGSEMIQRWTTRLPINDATDWIDAGDFDGDGQLEFIAGCRSNATSSSESQSKSRHWAYFIFESTGDNEYTKADSLFILGNANVSTYSAGIDVGDVNADGRDDILISAFPDQYIVTYDPATDSYLPRWHYMPSQSGTMLIADLDADGINEFFFNDGQFFRRVEAAAAGGEQPSAPLGLTGTPVGSTSIVLQWRSVAGADHYWINRSTADQPFSIIESTTDTAITLSNVDTDVAYRYAVQTYDPEFPDPESVLSSTVIVIANSAPSVEDTAEFVEPHFVRVRFSEAMGPFAYVQGAYKLDDQRMPAVITGSEGGRAVYLAFDGTFEERQYSLTISGVRDAQDSRLPESTVVFFIDRDLANPPRIVTHRLLGEVSVNQVEITYSDSMSAITVLNPLNYGMDYGRAGAPTHVESVRSITQDNRQVRVSLFAAYPVGAMGLPARMLIRGVQNESGVEIDTASGQADLLLGGAASNLNSAYVFPNPFRGIGAGGGEGVHFAGLPEKATIRIFTIQGVLVREIEHIGFAGAAAWDLENDQGKSIASGVYIFVIESAGDEVRGKLAVMR